jgi:hypothetical protein
MEICLAIELSDDQKKLIESETAKLYGDYGEFLWYDTKQYRIVLYAWNGVEKNMLPKLSQKIEDLVFDIDPFIMYSRNYFVSIGATRIDLHLGFQREAKFTRLMRSLEHCLYGSGTASKDDNASISIARYKVPSKQQYMHLKNKLERMATDVIVNVDKLSLVHLTDFGHGAKEGVVLDEILLPTATDK